MDLIKRIYKSSVFVLIPLAAASAFIEWKKLPLSIITGGVLGLLNVRALAWSVRGLLGSQKATGRMIIFSMLRLLMLFIILSSLIYLGLVNVFGILAGLTAVFALIIIEGLRYAKDNSESADN
jgi:hypothetical protein